MGVFLLLKIRIKSFIYSYRYATKIFMGQIYNIPFGIDFCDVLSKELLKEVESNPLELSKYIIILPTLRSKRNLQQAFSKNAKNLNLILPLMLSINNLDESDLELLTSEEIPSVLPNIKRTFLLSEFILKIKSLDLNYAQSIQLASELGNLFDKIETQGLNIDNFEQIVPEEFAKHWQITLEFLKIIYNSWQDYLKENDLVSSAKQRNLILQSQAKIWEQTDKHIIIAGFSSTIPAMLNLIKTVYSLNNGKILIQGLDRSLDFSSLSEIDYLYGTYEILNKLGISATAVKDLLEISSLSNELTASMMLPADKTDDWRTSKKEISAESIKNIDYIECENEQKEAEIISIIIRKEIENKDKHISLVTPNRTLARCVASNLQRWNILANDSSGQPLIYTPIGNWLLLTAQMVIEKFAPIALLACLKHPFSSSSKDWILNLEKCIRKKEDYDLSSIKESLGILDSNEKYSFPEFLQAHISFCEKLAQTEETSGAEIMWSSEFGESCANFIHNIFENSTDALMTFEEYFSILSLLLSSETVRAKYGFHPRLSILGLTESRLFRSDVAILGGLNEEVWPPAPDVNSWMSRPMQKDFGLQSNDLNIGLSGFDFANSFNSEKVYLTRSKRSNNSINIKSRWLNRLEGVLKSANITLEPNKYWEKLALKLNSSDEVVEFEKPNPCPPLESRPTELSATNIDLLLKDPYALYAKKILKLIKQDPLEEEISVATKGTIIHDCLEQFIKRYPKELPENSNEIFNNICEEVFEKQNLGAEYISFWKPKLINIFSWFIENEEDRREIMGYENLLTEEFGEINIDNFKIYAKADRIDVNSDGVEIIDYKTGTPPSKKDIISLKYTQLPVEALIFDKGGFGYKNDVSRISIWSLKGLGVEKPTVVDVDEELLEKTEIFLRDLISHFRKPETTYPSETNYPPLGYNDYKHLERKKMWRNSDDSF